VTTDARTVCSAVERKFRGRNWLHWGLGDDARSLQQSLDANRCAAR
jgi:hypothetical protein